MGLRNFRLNVLVRTGTLVVLLAATLWSFLNTDWEITPYVCLLLFVGSVFELVHYVETTNRKFNNFLNFVLHRDFSGTITGAGEGKAFEELESTSRLINREFRKINAEKAANTLYLEFVLEHVDVALLCLDQDGAVSLINKRAKQMFGIRYLRDLDALKKFSAKLPGVIRGMARNSQELVEINSPSGEIELSIHATQFKLLSQNYQLISFQNIRSELEQHEISSWEKLIRVLTHEVMNSVTPIISLSGVLEKKLICDPEKGNGLQKISDEEISDIHNSIKSIEARSKGLQKFVQSYRRLTAVPQPSFSTVPLRSLADEVCTLMQPELDKQDIKFELTGAGGNQLVEVDPQQMEQVLINLITNAKEALANHPAPVIHMHIEKGKSDNLLLSVTDNGPGIELDNRDQLFVPFFTTKPGGEGIGLSLSRQLCIKNRVLLSLVSSSESGTSFMLNFKVATE